MFTVPITKMTFEHSEIFGGKSTQKNDQAWNSLMPVRPPVRTSRCATNDHLQPGDGFINVENPRQYKLPPGQKTPKGEIYDISLFHQLHCLSAIRAHVLLLELAIGRNNSQEISDLLLRPQESHVYHCIDYIRQGLMCAGDMTVEWPREEEDGRRFAVDGWGVTHQCKDWVSFSMVSVWGTQLTRLQDAIMKFMEENDSSKSFIDVEATHGG